MFAIYIRGLLAVTGLPLGEASAIAQCLALEFPGMITVAAHR